MIKKFFKELYNSTVLKFIVISVLLVVDTIIYNLSPEYSLMEDIAYYGLLCIGCILLGLFIYVMFYAIKNTVKDIFDGK